MYIHNVYQFWTFDEVDTLFYGPNRGILTENFKSKLRNSESL